jgi:pyruvate dehydrogenase E1 component
VQDQIARWVPTDWQSLGADGYGFADTRAAARRFFQIDAESIVVSALQTLARRGEVKPETVAEAFARFKIDDPTAVSDVEQEGSPA